MKALIVYDSFFGNTERVAQAVAAELGTQMEVQALRVAQADPRALSGLNVLVVGSPTRAFSPSPEIKKFLSAIPSGSLAGTRIAGFDTRIDPEESNSGFLKFMVKLFGFAAEPIAAKLMKKGAQAAAAPAGFFVNGTEGPLREGELERAAAWARQILMTSMG